MAPPIPVVAQQIHEQSISYAEWPNPPSGTTILDLQVVQFVLAHFAENAEGGDITVVISYPGGDSGRTWGGELYNWLVSFGIPTAHLRLEVGSGASDQLLVTILDRR